MNIIIKSFCYSCVLGNIPVGFVRHQTFGESLVFSNCVSKEITISIGNFGIINRWLFLTGWVKNCQVYDILFQRNEYLHFKI